ncbi:putative Succinate dehydrogenase cytochrome B subunit [Seiridium cardinale]|uniref:Succinate dehydrogenase cytochrome B subunit n=1 Tax=Seiridium cardinale TaxID=138064 RepID=A0ABR2XV47_9PEZI
MISQRVGVSALRQVARKPNAAFFSQNLPRLAMGMQARWVPPLPQSSPRNETMANLSAIIRGASTTKFTESDAQTLLATQRRSRPVAPHLQIYDFSQTFFASSIWTRITGSIFSGGLYAFSAAYLVAPLFGWHLESASIAAAFGSLPVALKGGMKFLVAWPFVFHCVNGVRHLMFDLVKGYSKSSIKTTGTAIWGASIVTALGIAFLL